MTDLHTNRLARPLDARGRKEAERARRKRRSHWSYTKPAEAAATYRLPMRVPEAHSAPRPAFSTSGATMVEELEVVRRGLGLTMAELWWRYFALGGDFSPSELEAVLHQALVPTATECNVLAVALNERSQELGVNRRMLFWSGVST